MKTAGLIIIGDEILNGKVKDENTFVFAQLMFSRGVELKKIIVIPDEINTIASSISEFTKSYDYVASSGGIGPTHDDITLEAVALSFNKKLVKHDKAISYFQAAQEKAGRGSLVSDVQLKMLTYPEGSQVYFAEPMWLPLIRCENLFILPGVPRLFSLLLSMFGHLFEGKPFFREIIYSDQYESAIAESLGEIQNKYPLVKIGSYPQEAHQACRVIVSVEGRDEQMVKQASSEIRPLIVGRLKQ